MLQKLKAISLVGFTVLALTIVLLSVWYFSTRPRWVLLRDAANRPIAGARVTLTTELGETVALTDEFGHAYLDRRYTEAPAQMVIEKEGYAVKTMRYPGKVSLLENLYEPGASR